MVNSTAPNLVDMIHAMSGKIQRVYFNLKTSAANPMEVPFYNDGAPVHERRKRGSGYRKIERPTLVKVAEGYTSRIIQTPFDESKAIGSFFGTVLGNEAYPMDKEYRQEISKLYDVNSKQWDFRYTPNKNVKNVLSRLVPQIVGFQLFAPISTWMDQGKKEEQVNGFQITFFAEKESNPLSVMYLRRHHMYNDSDYPSSPSFKSNFEKAVRLMHSTSDAYRTSK